MLMIKIEPVAKPKSFTDVGFSESDWNAARKAGVLTVPSGTALENVRLSKGLYRFVPKTEEIEIILKGLPDVAEMDGQALAAEMASHGKPPQKQMKVSKAREFVAALRAKATEMIVDD